MDRKSPHCIPSGIQRIQGTERKYLDSLTYFILKRETFVASQKNHKSFWIIFRELKKPQNLVRKTFANLGFFWNKSDQLKEIKFSNVEIEMGETLSRDKLSWQGGFKLFV